MKKLTVFPYREDAGGLLFPVIPLRFHIGKKIVDSNALIDSGATISIFKAEIAESLGIKIETGEVIWLGGVGGHREKIHLPHSVLPRVFGVV